MLGRLTISGAVGLTALVSVFCGVDADGIGDDGRRSAAASLRADPGRPHRRQPEPRRASGDDLVPRRKQGHEEARLPRVGSEDEAPRPRSGRPRRAVVRGPRELTCTAARSTAIPGSCEGASRCSRDSANRRRKRRWRVAPRWRPSPHPSASLRAPAAAAPERRSRPTGSNGRSRTRTTRAHGPSTGRQPPRPSTGYACVGAFGFAGSPGSRVSTQRTAGRLDGRVYIQDLNSNVYALSTRQRQAPLAPPLRTARTEGRTASPWPTASSSATPTRRAFALDARDGQSSAGGRGSPSAANPDHDRARSSRTGSSTRARPASLPGAAGTLYRARPENRAR